MVKIYSEHTNKAVETIMNYSLKEQSIWESELAIMKRKAVDMLGLLHRQGGISISYSKSSLYTIKK